MLYRIILFVGFTASPAVAAAQPYFVVLSKGAVPTGSPSKLQFGNHGCAMVRREKSGEVESHDTRAIVMIVQSGEATLVVDLTASGYISSVLSCTTIAPV
jgi:hypothetical protein